MVNLQFRVATDIVDVKEAWNELSPHQVIDDEWDFRYAFLKPLSYELRFIAGYDGEQIVGLLPLQRNNLTGLRPPYGKDEIQPFLEFFGGDDMDDNVILLKPGYEECVLQFFDQIKERAILAPLATPYVYKQEAQVYEHKFFLLLTGYASYEDYLEHLWSKDSRKKIRQQIRNIHRDFKVEIINNNYEDITLLSTFNKERFGETSSFSHEYRQSIFESLTSLYAVETLTIILNGVKQGVSYGIHYKDRYVGMNAGVSYDVQDLGKYLAILQIQQAIELGCSMYDAGKGSSGWKEAYRFQKSPQYQLFFD